MKLLITFAMFVLCMAALVSNAQDVIVKTNGDEIKAKVLEVNLTEIKYKNADNLDGATYVISKATVFMVRYANGTKDVINPVNDIEKKQAIKNTDLQNQKPINNQLGNENIPSGFVSVAGGIGLPISDFNNLALSGQNYSVYAAYPIAKSNYGIAIKIDDNANDLKSSYAESLVGGVVTPDGGYRLLSFKGGLYITLPINKVAIDFRLLGGLCSYSQPAINYFQTYAFYSLSENTVNASSFVYDGGMSIRYSFAAKMCGMLNVDYLSTKQSWTDTGFGMFYDFSSFYINENKSATFTLLNITVGIGYQF